MPVFLSREDRIIKSSKKVLSSSPTYEELKLEFKKLLKSYEKSDKRLNKIMKLGDKQQERVHVLNEELNKKTFELESLNETLELMVKKEVAKNRKKDKDMITIFKSLLDANPNPIILYTKKGIVKYANKPFLKLVNISKKKIINKNFSIDSITDKDSKLNILSTIDTISSLEENHFNKVIIKTDKGRKIFNIIKKEVVLVNSEVGFMHTFNDITIQEYQKLKIEDYSRRLEQYILQVRKKDKEIVKESKLLDDKERAITVDTKDKLETETSKTANAISSDEREVIRRSHKHKIPAVDYVEELGDDLLVELDDLQDLEVEMYNILIELEQKHELKTLNKFAVLLIKYCSTINFLTEFDDLIFGLNKLADILFDVSKNSDSLCEKKFKKITTYLLAIEQDLLNWNRSIFIDKNTKDIHYLDSSLLSSFIQLEMIVYEQDRDDEEEEDFLELF